MPLFDVQLSVLVSEEGTSRAFSDYDEERLMESCLRFGTFAYLTRSVAPTHLQQVLSIATRELDMLA